jgi:hypothetical protein
MLNHGCHVQYSKILYVWNLDPTIGHVYNQTLFDKLALSQNTVFSFEDSHTP